MDAREVEMMTEEEAKAVLVKMIEMLDELQDSGGLLVDDIDWRDALDMKD